MTRYALSWCIAVSLGIAGPLPAENAPVGSSPQAHPPRFVVSELERDQPTSGPRHAVPTLGPQPQVTILLRYSDIPGTPEPTSYFQTLMLSNDFPGLNHFLKEISYNIANVDGSQVVAWINLPGNWDYYNWAFGEFDWPRLDIDRVLADCIPMVDSMVDFPFFNNIVLMLNEEHGCGDAETCGPWAGAVGRSLNIDGETQDYGIQFFGPYWFRRQAAIGHEMMHTFGVHHSGPLVEGGEPSHWDVVTGSGTTCDDADPVNSCYAVYTIAWNMLELGWMPPERSYNTGTSGAGIVTIEHLALPPLAGGTYGMAQLLVNGSPDFFYTVEYRTPVGWDGAGPIPGQAVILHRVDTTLEDLLAEVVDPDGNGDPNDDAAMWLPGETYLNTSAAVVVHIESWNDNSAVVSVSNKARASVYVWNGATGYEDGSPMDPWNTVEEGYASVYPNGTVHIFPGNYPETLTMSKPCRLERSYGTEPAIIGE